MTLLTIWLTLANASLQAADQEQPLEFFEKKVRPLLVSHCYECHSVKSKSLKAGLRVDSRSALLKGGDSGAAISSDQPDQSLLLEAVRYEAYEMPPKGKLPAADIAILERWVKMGAPWPEEPEPVADASPPPFDLEARKASHWCWQPVRRPELPAVQDAAWVRDDIDRFILAKLEERGFQPAPTVDRRVLIRRLSFDLIGLPPTPGEVDEFVSDPASNAVEKVVDRLLESPHFGERWGRHWLDLVRYAESRGHEFDNDTPNAWQYRDYVIRALNADVPYDQFVKEHIAGDLLDPPRLHPEKKFNESILGTGFWHLGEWVHSPVDIRKDETDRFDNMLDVMSKAFLGVTVACARCHDHKFDAISQKDYYALSGFLQGSDYRQVPFEALEHNKWLAGEVAKVDAEANRRIWQALGRKRLKAIEQGPVGGGVGWDESRGGIPWDDPGPLPPRIRVLVDYRDGSSDGFQQDGAVYGQRPALPGEVILREGSRGQLMTEYVRAGYAHSHPVWKTADYPIASSPNQKGRLESLSRNGRTLRSRTFDLQSGEVNCRVRGSGAIVACVDSHRLIAGPLHGETVINVLGDSDEWRWIPVNLARYVGHRVHLEFTPSVGQSLDVQLAIEGSPPEPVLYVNSQSISQEQLKRIVQAWADGEPVKAEDRQAAIVFGAQTFWDASRPESVVPSEASLSIVAERLRWAEEIAEVRQGISSHASLAPAMLDGSGEDDRLLIRGNSSTPGDAVRRRFLEVIDGPKAMTIPAGSGRRELAEHITDPANPLTSRVVVNRLWHHLLGRGIVPTVDDFGVLGQRPTHPELLDYLATEFQKDGQSLKRMIRRIVLSQTYRMSGDTDPKTVEADPKNDLWHHRPPKRLEGEVIRDALLAVSGRLDRTPFGPSVKVHLTSFMEGRGRPSQSGPMDGENRRSIYLEVRRNFLSPFMLTFDTPNPFSTMGRRNSSNVPAQALILMNDPFVRDCAESWARRAIQEGPADPNERIAWFCRTAFGRQPTEPELQLVREYLSSAGDTDTDLAKWTDIAHAIINMKEFVFVP
ncbi:PSD1 and planctomycete cytochrome C domain-containing protein [Caulifigura coniformis]|uniref:PSD1 and planctomycete cytochrome C domain-containing protein n=1 Tax=Caulifigura coniformis TaxID=2527983 RepID=UPI001E616428|nr:PSD1 and planctomycete cytochrome C domain-containing protein [Caulifigura coniformis]